jgi:hypothetical protein
VTALAERNHTFSSKIARVVAPQHVKSLRHPGLRTMWLPLSDANGPTLGDIGARSCTSCQQRRAKRGTATVELGEAGCRELLQQE